MARLQGNGGKIATIVGLVFFAIASCVLMFISITLHAKINKAEQTAKAAKAEVAKYVSDQDKQNQMVQHYLNNPKGGTVVGQMLKTNAAIKKQYIGVDRTATNEQIRKRLVDEKISQTLLDEVSTLRSQIAALNTQLKNAKQDRDQAEADKATALAQVKQIQDSFNQTKEKLNAAVQQRSGQVKTFEDQITNLQVTNKKQAQETQSSLSKRLAALRAKKEKLQTKITALEKKITQMTGQPASQVAKQYFVSADGKIVSVISNTDKVMINLGRDQHMLLGMTFEVFNPDKKVELEGPKILKGKATIQVMEVHEDSSLARVVWRKQGTSLNQGDKIINLVYNPAHPFRFAVFGKFDIDASGTPTTADRDRIKLMIHRWGGNVTDSMGYNVDFVVMGHKPSVPKPLPEGTVDPEAITKHTAHVKAYQQYLDLMAAAKRLSIPVLNQNRFLTLVGYYQR